MHEAEPFDPERSHPQTTSRPIPRVAFVCTHNSCRSQMAEAIAKQIAKGTFAACSAGTHPREHINHQALQTLANHGYGTDGLRSKPLDDIPPVDWVVTMGCGVACPALPCAHREDWGLEDPSGKDDSSFEACLALIEDRIADLKKRIEATL